MSTKEKGEERKERRVYVGLSGGVDSSVSAFLLKEAGYEVTGVFIRGWYPDFIPCNWQQDKQDAMRVCARLNIPFKICDLEKEYKKHVVDYLISEYKNGRTPNPDIMCNKYIKFDGFLNFALAEGADYIATGHYAQVEKVKDQYKLLNSTDTEKDQTYFLWNLNQDILEKVLFPIGHLKKEDVRKIAKRNKLITADKKDSQGLCFINNVEMKNFLQHYLKTEPGDVLNESGKVIGRHDGAVLYTIGERHGFEIFHDETDSRALYIIDKDLNKNSITVSDKKTQSNSKTIKVDNLNFVRKTNLENKKVLARIRYRQLLEDCKIIKIENDQAVFEFEKEQDSITPGQSLVFYSDNECLGGGIINR